MRKSRFTEAQRVAIPSEADKSPVAELAKEHAISGQSIYTRRRQSGAMGANDVKRMRPPEVENNRLKKIVAEREGWQNGTTERFNGKFRDECLSMEWFRNRIEARTVIGQ